jgi:hypothetical protein
MWAWFRLLVPPAAALALAGCGGGQHAASSSTPPGSSSTTPPSSSTPRRTPPPLRRPGTRAADPAAVRVIRAWVDAERRSDMARAARYFSLPAVVANGGPPQLLRTRLAVRLWNASLPCGARLVEAVAYRGYTVARFRLTQRPGQRCDGTGDTASTAFKLRRGLIAQWVRVDDEQPFQAPPGRAAPLGGPSAA